ncbi:DUF1289 domain-containing protein [uncultured Gilliamella sp.]|uniref:DUF1289 domain-containing protein n=1 Tax=uncultured Gilliamella sp. TaxID=1193505 RepID=UPI0025F00C16|nr:DUF1289 domain-containing protein [uncultured Gilliamella sp.]
MELFDIQSPCQRVCETDKRGYCCKCYRSREERFNWLTFSDAQKRRILYLCKLRMLRRGYLQKQKKQQSNQVAMQIDLNF